MEKLAAQIVSEAEDDQAILPDGKIKPDCAAKAGRTLKTLIAEYEELRRKTEEKASLEEQKDDTYNHLCAFFSRYYDDGDFIPRHFFGARNRYVVPYNGEETLFHWANRDQYYVKSGENFQNYAFQADTVAGSWRIQFRIVEAATPPGNTKGETRFFFPQIPGMEVDHESKHVTVPFHYRLPTEQEVKKFGPKSKGQTALLREAAPAIVKAVSDPMLAGVLGQIVHQTEKGTLTLLDKRLRHFTRKNTTDFFVHKRLREFLLDELEFYIRDQVVHFMDMDADAATLEKKRLSVRVFRRLSERIIDFLTRIEDAQKTLFEKKKFALAADYLVPIEHVPENLREEVLSNKAQIRQWKDWFSIKPKKALFNQKGKINTTFLEQHPTLTVDTRCFDPDFKLRLLCALSDHFGDLDEATDGVLIHSENFQALKYLLPRCEGRVGCIYIDPPYNAAETEILYKNAYKHSSWMALLFETLLIARGLLVDSAIMCVTIDDYENIRLKCGLDRVFGEEGYMATVLIRNNPSGRSTVKGFAVNHEYAIFYSKGNGNAKVSRLKHSEKQIERYDQIDKDGRAFEWENFRKSSAGSNRSDRPKQFFPIYWSDPKKELRIPFMEWEESGKCWKILEEKGPSEIEVWPINGYDVEKVWNWGVERTKANLNEMLVEEKGNKVEIYKKKYLRKEGSLPRTWWDKAAYSARDNGTRTIVNLFGSEHRFAFPKSVFAVEDCLRVSSAIGEPLCLDYFAGSGTTGHAVINLNREDGGRRKFILVEMGDYFNTVLVPRIAKVMCTPEWNAGKPKRTATQEESKRTPRLVKILKLESYEDALHNLTKEDQLKGLPQIDGDDGARRISYVLERLMERSDSMLGWEALDRPFDCTMEFLTDEGVKIAPVDLVETFNALYGLRVQQFDLWRDPETDREYRVIKADKADGGKVLVIWRNVPPEAEAARDRAFLEARIGDLGEWNEAWVNGPCAMPGLKPLDGMFKQLITGLRN